MAVAQSHVPRLLHLVRLLEKNGEMSLARAAGELGVSERELEEDVRLLSTCGVPPYSPGDLFEIELEGDRVRLGRRLLTLPRFQLSAEEVAGLRLAARLAESEGWGESRALKRALSKLEAALLPEERERGRKLARRIGLSQTTQPVARHLATLERAVRDRREVEMTYYSEASERQTRRRVRPYAIAATPDGRYLVAHDEASGEIRTFRVDRVHRLKPTTRSFEVADDFDASRYLPFAAGAADGRTEVTLRFDPAVARLAQETFPGAVTERDGAVSVRLRVWPGPGLWRLVMSWAGACEVVAPDEAREAVREYARAIEAAYR